MFVNPAFTLILFVFHVILYVFDIILYALTLSITP